MNDPRLSFFRQKVESVLGVSANEAGENLFDQFCLAPENTSALQTFLDGSSPDPCVMFWTEMVESVEILAKPEKPKQEAGLENKEEGASAPVESEKPIKSQVNLQQSKANLAAKSNANLIKSTPQLATAKGSVANLKTGSNKGTPPASLPHSRHGSHPGSQILAIEPEAEVEDTKPRIVQKTYLRSGLKISSVQQNQGICYFMRTKPGAIPNTCKLSSIHSACDSPLIASTEVLCEYLQTGHISLDVLADLERLIDAVYFPMLTNSNSSDVNLGSQTLVNLEMEPWKKDLITILRRFSSNLSHISQQLHEEVELKIPKDPKFNKIINEQSVKIDNDVLNILKDLGENWVSVIQKSLLQESKKAPLGDVCLHCSRTSY